MQPELHMTRQVYDQIRNTIGRRPPESGGILGSSDGGKTIDRFYFDATAKVTGGTYSPDTEVINRVLAHWDAQDILLVGFVHSHPKGNVYISFLSLLQSCLHKYTRLHPAHPHCRLPLPDRGICSVPAPCHKDTECYQKSEYRLSRMLPQRGHRKTLGILKCRCQMSELHPLPF